MSETPVTAIILAGQRASGPPAFVREAGLEQKCLLPILGRPLIQYVVEALTEVPDVKRIRVCVDLAAAAEVRSVCGAAESRGIALDFVAPKPTLTESVYASAEGVEGPILLTTGDNVNLTAEAVRLTLAELGESTELVLALCRRSAVLAARDDAALGYTDVSRIGPYRFADDRYSNCNLYALGGPSMLKAAEAFREGGQFSKHKLRLLHLVGAANVALYALRLLTLEQAMRRLSQRLGFKLRAVVLPDGAQAVDVDNPRTYRIAQAIRAKREPARAEEPLID